MLMPIRDDLENPRGLRNGEIGPRWGGWRRRRPCGCLSRAPGCRMSSSNGKQASNPSNPTPQRGDVGSEMGRRVVRAFAGSPWAAGYGKARWLQDDATRRKTRAQNPDGRLDMRGRGTGGGGVSCRHRDPVGFGRAQQSGRRPEWREELRTSSSSSSSLSGHEQNLEPNDRQSQPGSCMLSCRVALGSRQGEPGTDTDFDKAPMHQKSRCSGDVWDLTSLSSPVVGVGQMEPPICGGAKRVRYCNITF